jgi:hypothetical protein
MAIEVYVWYRQNIEQTLKHTNQIYAEQKTWKAV